MGNVAFAWCICGLKDLIAARQVGYQTMQQIKGSADQCGAGGWVRRLAAFVFAWHHLFRAVCMAWGFSPVGSIYINIEKREQTYCQQQGASVA